MKQSSNSSVWVQSLNRFVQIFISEKQKICAGEDHPNIKTQLIIGALKFAEFPGHISIDYMGT